MKLVILVACCLAVVLAAPKPDEQDDDRQQLRRRLHGLQAVRLRLTDTDPYVRNDRYHDHDREEELLRKIVQRGNQVVPVHIRSQQPYHDLGSLSFRYYPPTQTQVKPYPIHGKRVKYDSDVYPIHQNYYRGSVLREQDHEQEEEEQE